MRTQQTKSTKTVIRVIQSEMRGPVVQRCRTHPEVSPSSEDDEKSERVKQLMKEVSVR